MRLIMMVVGILGCMASQAVDEAEKNFVLVIEPYRHYETWVFDDKAAGLDKEPFFAGVPRIIDKLVEDIPDADKGFRLLFSAKAFHGATHVFHWRRGEQQGNWYYSKELDMEGWLCPALFKYFREAPRKIYVKAEPRQAAEDPPREEIVP